MSTKLITHHISSTAEELIEALKDMVQTSGRDGSVIYLKTNQDDRVFASLEEETLTDGSKVYNIIVR